ncbi:MAG: nucleoside-diphosphate kinase [Thermoanaerobacteraceae bacterium]|nr:nucleoside-diphosphate kinase [Thermoanaerobacteraceae bacterium]
MERTLVIIKPDGVKRGLVGEIIKRYEQKNLVLKSIKIIYADIDVLKKHYYEHIDKDYFTGLIDYMMSGPIIPMIWEGENAIKLARAINGDKNIEKALPGSIRGDFATTTTYNIVHASDSLESAMRESKLWFPEFI